MPFPKAYPKPDISTLPGCGHFYFALTDLRSKLCPVNKRGNLEAEMYPPAISTQSEIQAAIGVAEKSFAPDVVHIRYEIGKD